MTLGLHVPHYSPIGSTNPVLQACGELVSNIDVGGERCEALRFQNFVSTWLQDGTPQEGARAGWWKLFCLYAAGYVCVNVLDLRDDPKRDRYKKLPVSVDAAAILHASAPDALHVLENEFGFSDTDQRPSWTRPQDVAMMESAYVALSARGISKVVPAAVGHFPDASVEDAWRNLKAALTMVCSADITKVCGHVAFHVYGPNAVELARRACALIRDKGFVPLCTECGAGDGDGCLTGSILRGIMALGSEGPEIAIYFHAFDTTPGKKDALIAPDGRLFPRRVIGLLPDRFTPALGWA